MPKYNPKEARDVKARKQKRIAASKKKRHFRQFVPYILIIGVIIIVGSMAIYFYLSDYNNGEDGGENGGNGDNNQYETPMTFTTIDEDTIKLADNQGKVIILYFFDLDCPPCGPQAEILAEIDKDYSSSQLLIIHITVHYWDSTNDLIIWKQNYNQNWDIVRDDASYSYSTPFNIAYTPFII